MLSSSLASSGRVSSPPPTGKRLARMSSWIRRSRVGSPEPSSAITTSAWVSAPPRTSCISRASRPHEASSGLRAADTVWSSRRGRCLVPGSTCASRRFQSSGDGWRRKRLTSRPAGHGVEDVQVTRGQPRQPKQREPWGEIEQVVRVPELAARAFQVLRRARTADAFAQEPPQFELPRRLVGSRYPGRPAPEHVRAVHRIAVEEVRHVPDDGEPLRPFGRPRHGLVLGDARIPDVVGQWRQPGVVEVRLDDLHERPHGTLGQPRVGFGVIAGGPGQGGRDESPGKGKVDVGAHPVVRSGRDAKLGGEALAEPPLDTLGRHGDDLRRHRVLERFGHQPGQHRHQDVGSI